MTEEKLFVLKDPSAFGLTTFLRSLEAEEKTSSQRELLTVWTYLPHDKTGYNSPEATLQPCTGNKNTALIAGYSM